MEILKRIRECIAPSVAEKEVELVDILFRREGGNMVLRLLVDKPGGIMIGECEILNRQLSELLDNADIIQDPYVLEVSSPGLDRPVKSDNDYKRVIGKSVRVTTYNVIDGKRDHEGTLVGFNEQQVVIERNGCSTVIPREKIAKAVQKIEF